MHAGNDERAEGSLKQVNDWGVRSKARKRKNRSGM